MGTAPTQQQEVLPLRRDNLHLAEEEELIDKRLELLSSQRRYRFTLDAKEKKRLRTKIISLKGEITRLRKQIH